jgi:DNA-directed RNA polymerase subunit RPC12/RpoP
VCTLVIMNSADCHPKPDPQVNLDYPCFVCGKEVLDDHAGIHCDDYHCGYHTSCINTVNNTYNILSKSNISWICAKCCSLNTTHSNIHDNPINGQHCLVIKLIHLIHHRHSVHQLQLNLFDKNVRKMYQNQPINLQQL